MSDETVKRSRDWDQVRQLAEKRPTMFIGDAKSAHLYFISSVLRLVWQAKIFRTPFSVSIDLSPNQYLVRAMSGPLIRPIQNILSFGTGKTLNETWRDEFADYSAKIVDEDEARGIPFSHQRLQCHRPGWRYCFFSSPYGPRLEQLSFSSLLSHSFIWGLRTNQGLWCEAYKDSRPADRPFLVTKPSPVGCFAAASLNSQWFTGLPFDSEDVERLANISNRQVVGDPKYAPQPAYTRGPITVNWHPNDDLVTKRLLTPEGVQEWL